jgi:aldehyde:ferredoxin oxidoreductase
LPDRLFQPLKGGSQEGSAIPRDDFERGKKLYYEMNGWDGETGIPTQGKLIELNLDGLIGDLH